jgi:hypothetical protein
MAHVDRLVHDRYGTDAFRTASASAAPGHT